MGNKLVSDLLPIMGAEVKPLAPLTYTKIIYEHFPFFLSIGMTEQQYFDGDCCLVKHYRQAHEYRKKMQNELMWLQGLYVYDAILHASPALRAMGASEPMPYPEEPYAITEEDIRHQEEKRQAAAIEAARARMIERAQMHNRNFELKGGETDAGS